MYFLFSILFNILNHKASLMSIYNIVQLLILFCSQYAQFIGHIVYILTNKLFLTQQPLVCFCVFRILMSIRLSSKNKKTQET